jgi:hypothetical protein
MLRNDLYAPWFTDNEHWGVEFLSGEFQGVIVQIEKMEFADNENGVELAYHVISKPEAYEEELSGNKLFESQMELVINDILKEALDIFENEQNRNNDTEESST